MKAFLYALVVSGAALLLAGCSAGIEVDPGGGGTSSVTVSIAPTSTNAAANVTVAATFSGAITEPASASGWLTSFALRAVEGGAATGLSQCTGVSYDASTRTATCQHAALENGTIYEASVYGVFDSAGLLISGSEQQFTTVSAPSAVAKTSVATAEDGAGELSFLLTFDAAAASVARAPSADAVVAMSIVRPDGSGEQEVECVRSAAGTLYTCPFTGLGGCTTVDTYDATLTIDGVVSESYRFSTADDEFDDSATLEFCWGVTNTISPGDASPEISQVVDEEEGLLVTTIVSADARAAGRWRNKTLTEAGGVAMSLSIAANDYPGGAQFEYLSLVLWDEVANALLLGEGQSLTTVRSWWLQGGGWAGAPIAAIERSYPALPTDFCIVQQADVARAFVRFIDSDWLALGSDVLACTTGDCGDYEVSTADWPAVVGSIFIQVSDEAPPDETYITEVDSMRFSTDVVAGDASDCPEL